ncbi:MAG: TIGR00266 family protein [Pseudobdellovibrio sp.]
MHPIIQNNPLNQQKIHSEIIGGDSFKMIKVSLSPAAEVITEPGAMASHQVSIRVKTELNGNIFKALMSFFFGGESVFVSRYKNSANTDAVVYLTQATPGAILHRELKGEALFIEKGAFIARTKGVRGETVWAGFTSFIAGEGLFRLKYTGYGSLWFGSYGAVYEKEIKGDYIVDSNHLLAYPPTIKLNLTTAGGLIASFLSKEGFVLKLSGHGKVLLQTRSVKGLAQWLNSKFWG